VAFCPDRGARLAARRSAWVPEGAVLWRLVRSDEILRGTMSQENVEIVRRSTDAYNRRDLDGMLESWAQDAVLNGSNARSFDAYMRGRDGIEVQARSAWLIAIRDGKQTSLTLYQTKQEAVEAAGLRE
jgi:ketosteroid isomerase-like protein